MGSDEPMHPRRVSGRTAAVAGVLVVLVVAIIASIGSGMWRPSLGRAGEGSVVDSPSGPMSTPPAATATAIQVAGETPGPDASAPVGAVYLSGYTIADALRTLEGSGLACGSSRGGIPGDPSLYVLACTGTQVPVGYSLTVRLSYWAADRISEVHVVALPLEGAADPSALAPVLSGLVASPFEEVDRSAIAEWFARTVASDQCTAQACERQAGGNLLSVQGGGGAVGITIVSS